MKSKLNFAKKFFVPVIAISQLYAANILAEDKGAVSQLMDLSLEDMLNMQITTASRSSQSIKDTPTSTYVITKDEIQNNNYRSLSDALKNAPSVFATKTSTGFFGEQFSVRTLGGWYAKVLMNGIPYYPTGMQYPVSNEDINLKNVERIEIIYGPASALYGADAVAGVINIITMNPDKNTARGEIVVGEKGYTYGNAYGYANFLEDANKIKLGLYANYSKQNDINNKKGYENLYSKSNTYNISSIDPALLTLFPSTTPDYTGQKTPAKASVVGAEIRYRDIKLSYDRRDKENTFDISGNPYIYMYDENAKMKDSYTRWALQHELQMKDFELTSNVSYLKYRMKPDSGFKTIFAAAPTYMQYSYAAHDDINWEEVLNYTFLEKFKATAGFSYTYSGSFAENLGLYAPFDESKYKPFATSIDMSDPIFGKFGLEPKKYNNKGGFVQLAYNSDKINALAGVRYDKQSSYGSTTNPRIAFQYKINEDTSIRTSYAKAFKAPTPDLTDISSGAKAVLGTAPLTFTRPLYLIVPNDALQPEKLSSLEFGARHAFAKNIAFEAVYTYNTLTNCLQSAMAPLDTVKYPGVIQPGIPVTSINAAFGSNVLHYENSDKLKTQTHIADLILRTQKLIPAIDLGADLFYTRTITRFTLPNGNVLKKKGYAANSFGKLNIHAKPIDSLYLAFNNTFTGKFIGKVTLDQIQSPQAEAPGYLVSDLIANYEIVKGLGIHLEVQNLFDKKYYGLLPTIFEMEQVPQARRTIYGGINYTF